jgi:SAM-dependent methyltransferase
MLIIFTRRYPVESGFESDRPVPHPRPDRGSRRPEYKHGFGLGGINMDPNNRLTVPPGFTGINTVSMYDVEAHVAEIYDRIENYSDDVDLVKTLIGERKQLRILEPFCGTGRILIPLALAGHHIVGIDRAQVMLDRARDKISRLPAEVQSSVQLFKADILASEWPDNFDVVILGGNCLYELATSEEQDHCISRAARSLKPGGYIYLDNNHMEGLLVQSWQELNIEKEAFPTGICLDGTKLNSYWKLTWFDAVARRVMYQRRTIVTSIDGQSKTWEYQMGCHPPSTIEMKSWLDKYCFEVEKLFGDRSGGLYTDTSDRAIFWARKR